MIHGWAGSTAETYANAAGIAFEALQQEIISGECGEHLTWTLENGVLTISGTGVMMGYQADYMAIYAPWYDYRADIASVVIEYGAESIGSYAFYGCDHMTSLSIPDSVTIIRYNAFEGCAGLTNLKIPGSVTGIGFYAFGDCSGLTDLTISNGVATISSLAFYNCSGLTSLTIPASVTDIGYWTFGDCSGLTDMTILNPDAVIGDSDYDVFLGCASSLVIHGYSGSSAETYAAAAGIAFESLTPEPDFFLPSGLTVIESEAFAGIAAQAVVIPDTVTSIAADAFAGSQVTAIYGSAGSAAESFCAEHPEFIFIVYAGN